MSGTSEQRVRRIAIGVRQALLMICALIEREFGLAPTSSIKMRVEIIDESSDFADDAIETKNVTRLR